MAPTRITCRVRGCREQTDRADTDQFICKPHFRAADEVARQTWLRALHAAEKTEKLSPDYQRVVSAYRIAWAQLLASAQFNSLKSTRDARAAPQLSSRARRAADRDARMSVAFQRGRGIKATRKRGVLPLNRDKKRFEIALWLLFKLKARKNNYEAAYLAMLLSGPLNILPAERLDEAMIVLSGTPQKPAMNIEDYAGWIIRRSGQVVSRGEEFKRSTGKNSPELGWLLVSMMHLTLLFANDCEPAAVEVAYAELKLLGWRDALLEIVARWNVAMQSNFPPHATKKLKNAAAALRGRMKSVTPDK